MLSLLHRTLFSLSAFNGLIAIFAHTLLNALDAFTALAALAALASLDTLAALAALVAPPA